MVVCIVAMLEAAIRDSQYSLTQQIDKGGNETWSGDGKGTATTTTRR